MSTKLLAIVRDQIASTEAEKNTLTKERDVREAEATALTKTAEGENRDLDAKEASRFRELRSQLNDIDGKLDNDDEENLGVNQRLARLEERRSELVEHSEARDKAQKAAEQWADRAVSTETVGGVARVKSEPRTYSRDAERRGQSFYADLFSRTIEHDAGASERLDRHQREARLHELAGYEARDVGTGAFTGLTVPQYLTDMAAPLARAMAPTVQICNRHQLPEKGLSINISRLTTGTGVAEQSSEGDAVTETNADDTLLTVPVRTYAGMQDVSRQALDRGSGVDELITSDLVRAYWTKLDDGILNGSGSNGQHLGIRNTTNIEAVVYADGTPTAPELYPKLAELVSEIQSGVFMGLTHFIMAPRRWWWLASQVSTSRPFLHVQGVPTEQAGNIGATEYMVNNRNILGADVVVDGNLPTTLGGATNEDVILGVTDSELHLWHDDGPLFIRAEQPLAANLQVRLVAYSYSAFTAGRYPGAHGTISSTGLVTPTF